MQGDKYQIYIDCKMARESDLRKWNIFIADMAIQAVGAYSQG